jgi:peptide/nickel transport system ATP-binding protein
LQVEHLSVAIGKGTVREKPENNTENLAVDDIGFEVGTGEILGIVGESGCGKSLTALSIPGLLPQAAAVTTGHIRFEGRNLLDCSPKELRQIRGKELSMVFQEPAPSLNPLVKIGQQIGETLALHGEKDKGRIRVQTLEMMESLGLPEPEKLAEAYPHQLSGGMCQRVMIALAVICKPKLLIADEPTTALDVSTQAHILNLLDRINRDLGLSILFISHDLRVIRRLCRRVLVMYAGKIVEEGPVEGVFSRPAHEYTRGLLGALPGKDRKGKALTNIPGRVPAVGEKRSGCPFAPRCGVVRAACLAAFPAETFLSGDHRVHCVRAAEEAGRG